MFSLPAHSLPLCATTVYGTNTTEHTRPTAYSIRKRARRENLLTADSDPPALATQAMHGCRLRLRCEVPGLVPMCTRKAASLSAVGRQVDVRSARSGQSEVLETETTMRRRVKIGISANEGTSYLTTEKKHETRDCGNRDLEANGAELAMMMKALWRVVSEWVSRTCPRANAPLVRESKDGELEESTLDTLNHGREGLVGSVPRLNMYLQVGPYSTATSPRFRLQHSPVVELESLLVKLNVSKPPLLAIVNRVRFLGRSRSFLFNQVKLNSASSPAPAFGFLAPELRANDGIHFDLKLFPSFQGVFDALTLGSGPAASGKHASAKTLALLPGVSDESLTAAQGIPRIPHPHVQAPARDRRRNSTPRRTANVSVGADAIQSATRW
ncbi:hypothetical protein HMN09_00020800 [Mycena chlorophos]|uniref:Uncharacterized protein n=1 Tax=Mycena chlorophos TaxID=658473 RepID=A0A8H6WM36_MYCCL|nr:hypothetical protein HMN09_00020800 [Mycena chlorophos]